VSVTALLRHSIEAYKRNAKLISFFSVPLLIAFPLSLLLPNFIALSGTFLRFRSVASNLSAFEAFFITIVFLVALALFAFAVVAINVVVRSQRTLTRLTHREVEKIESCTMKLYLVFLTAFFITLVAAMLIYQYSFLGAFGSTLSLIIAFLAAVAVLFAPQAIVIDDLSVKHALSASFKMVSRKFGLFVFFLAFAGIVLLVNAWFFMQLTQFFLYSRFLGLVVNAVLIVPFLEVFKTQIYLSKYTLL